MDAKLSAAIDLFGGWVRAAGPEFGPKEETLHGWLLAALVESKFADSPMAVIQEVHFGEYQPDRLGELRSEVGVGH